MSAKILLVEDGEKSTTVTVADNGGGIGSAIPIIVYKNKERKIDEMRL